MLRTVVGLALAGWLISGCTQRRDYQPQVDPGTLDDSTFTHYLSTLPTVTIDEGSRAVLLAMGESDVPGDFSMRISKLESNRIYRSDWGLNSDDVLDRGTLAYMVYHMVGIKPGVNMMLLGSWGLGDRRYAIKEVVDEGLMEYGLPYEQPTGGEVLRVLARANEYRASTGQVASDEEFIYSPEDL